MSDRPCDVCKRPLWDGGHAVDERECDEPNGVKCRLLAEVADLRTRLAAAETDCEQWRARYNADIGQIACSLDWGNTPPLDVLVKDIRARRAGVVALNERLAASEAERERLHGLYVAAESRAEKAEAALAEHGFGRCVRFEDFTTATAAQAENAKLREALCMCRPWAAAGEVNLTRSGGYSGEAKAAHDAANIALALKPDNAALVEVCERVAWEVRRACGGSVVAAGSGWPTDFDVKAIVARVLGGQTK